MVISVLYFRWKTSPHTQDTICPITVAHAAPAQWLTDGTFRLPEAFSQRTRKILFRVILYNIFLSISPPFHIQYVYVSGCLYMVSHQTRQKAQTIYRLLFRENKRFQLFCPLFLYLPGQGSLTAVHSLQHPNLFRYYHRYSHDKHKLFYRHYSHFTFTVLFFHKFLHIKKKRKSNYLDLRFIMRHGRCYFATRRQLFYQINS